MNATILRQSPAVIMGIGPVYERRLTAAGVTNIATFLQRQPRGIQEILSDVSAQRVNEWFSAAWLLLIEGVTPELAEAFVDYGIDSIREMGRFGLRTLELAVRKAQKEGKLRKEPSLYSLAELQRNAGQLIGTAPVVGKIVNIDSGEPLANIKVRFGGRSTDTDEAGMFYLVGVPEGDPILRVESGYRTLMSNRQPVKAGRLGPTVTYHISMPPDHSIPEIREIDGMFIMSTRATETRFVTRKLENLPPDTYLRLISVSRTGRARLQHLYRTQIEQKILIDRVYVNQEHLPAESDIGDVLHLVNGQLSRTDLTLRDIARMKMESVFGPILDDSEIVRDHRPPVVTSSPLIAGEQAPGTLSIPVYYFHGDEGCGECQGEEGYKLGEYVRPHDDCDCTLEKITDLPGEYVYRNGTLEDLIQMRSAEYTVHNCKLATEYTHTSSLPDHRTSFWSSPGLKEYAVSKLGFVEPEIIKAVDTINIPAFQTAQFTNKVSLTMRYVKAELWFVTKVAGEIVETFMASHGGYVKKATSIEIDDVSFRDCPKKP